MSKPEQKDSVNSVNYTTSRNGIHEINNSAKHNINSGIINKGITVKKEENMPEWYEQVLLKSVMAEHAPIKGCMVIRPGGYAIWQAIQDYFNPVMARYGVKNAYFPMFIPESFFEREVAHAKGFKAEVAWVEAKGEDKQRYAIRPTSETIMYDTFSHWIRSWRDLPLKINQWCNIC